MAPKNIDYFAMLGKHRDLIVVMLVLGFILAGVSSIYIQKRFKVSVTLSMQSQYFQIPQLAGFAPEVYDTQELHAQRESLLHRALNHKFLEDIAQRYSLLSSTTGKQADTYDLDLLSKKFEIIPNGASGFIINFFGPSAEVSYQVIQDLLAHLRALMIEERHATLLTLHDAIEEQLEKIAFGKQSEVTSMFLEQPALIQHRIDRLKEEIDVLRKTYNDNHPRISDLRRQLETLSRLLTHAENGSPEGTSFDETHDEAFLGAKINVASTNLFEDLLRKYRYIEVVIHLDQRNQRQYLSLVNEPFMPIDPIWPRIPVLLGWGAVGGLFVGSALALLIELLRSRSAREGLAGSPPPFERELSLLPTFGKVPSAE